MTKTIPALLSFNNETSAGAVLDSSLGGLQISIPSGYQLEIKEGEENSRKKLLALNLH